MVGGDIGLQDSPCGQEWTVSSARCVRMPLVLVGLGRKDVQVAASSGTQVGSQLIYLCVCVCVCACLCVGGRFCQ